MEGLFHLEMKLTNPENGELDSKCLGRRSNSTSPELPKDNHLQSSLLGHETATPANNYEIRKASSQPQSQHPGAPMEDSENHATTPHKRCNGHAPLPADSAYFTTSECKAKFLTQYVNNKDMNNESINSSDGEELVKQKEELVARISRKLEILRIEQSEIREEIQSNELLGHTVVERVKQTAKRNEFDKFKLHVEAIEKITSLLLGLSGRLARAENALMGLGLNSSNPQEKKTLESKRDKLKEQLDEAKILKENIDRRSAQVSEFLQKYLTVEEYADYHHFTKMKAKLIIDSREIDDKIKLGDEQLVALQETLNTTS
jgi:protein Shroom